MKNYNYISMECLEHVDVYTYIYSNTDVMIHNNVADMFIFNKYFFGNLEFDIPLLDTRLVAVQL